MESNADAGILTMWHQQDGEGQPMPLDEVRRKAERLETRTRRWRVLTTGLVVLLVMIEAWQVWFGDEIVERAGDLLTIAAFLYVGYRYRRQRLAAPPVALGSTNCADFYRAELVRQRDLSKDSWGFLLPFVPGVTLALLGGSQQNRPVGQVIALVASGIGLFLGVAWWNAHTARKLQHEIGALDVS